MENGRFDPNLPRQRNAYSMQQAAGETRVLPREQREQSRGENHRTAQFAGGEGLCIPPRDAELDFFFFPRKLPRQRNAHSTQQAAERKPLLFRRNTVNREQIKETYSYFSIRGYTFYRVVGLTLYPKWSVICDFQGPSYAHENLTVPNQYRLKDHTVPDWFRFKLYTSQCGGAKNRHWKVLHTCLFTCLHMGITALY